MRVRAIATPGHTKGCTTWTFTVDDGGTARGVVMIGGTSAPGYRLVGNASYPQIVRDFEGTFRKLRSLEADITVEGHEFELAARRQSGFVDRTALGKVVDRAEAAVRKVVSEQKAPASGL